jgi:hypothetical protein
MLFLPTHIRGIPLFRCIGEIFLLGGRVGDILIPQLYTSIHVNSML